MSANSGKTPGGFGQRTFLEESQLQIKQFFEQGSSTTCEGWTLLKVHLGEWILGILRVLLAKTFTHV